MFVVWAVWVRAGWGLRPWIGQLVVLRCGAGWLVVCVGVEDTPVAAWLVVVGAPCVCGGWHAVGVLGQCALVAWPVFCCLFVGGGVWVWVGWL